MEEASNKIFLQRNFLKSKIFLNLYFSNENCLKIQKIKEFKIKSFKRNCDEKTFYTKLENINCPNSYKYILYKFISFKKCSTSLLRDSLKEAFGCFFNKCDDVEFIMQLCEDFNSSEISPGTKEIFKHLNYSDVPFLLYFIGTIETLKVAINMLPYFYEAYTELAFSISSFYWPDNYATINSVANCKIMQFEDLKNSAVFISPYYFLRDLDFPSDVMFCIFHLILFLESDLFEYNVFFYADYLKSCIEKSESYKESVESKKERVENRILFMNELKSYNKESKVYTTASNSKSQTYKFYRDSPLNSSISFNLNSSVNLSVLENSVLISKEKPEKIKENGIKHESCICEFINNLLGSVLCKMREYEKAGRFFEMPKLCKNKKSSSLNEIFFPFWKIDFYFLNGSKTSLTKILADLQLLKKYELFEKFIVEQIVYAKITLLQLERGEEYEILLKRLLVLIKTVYDKRNCFKWVSVLIQEDNVEFGSCIKEEINKWINVERFFCQRISGKNPCNALNFIKNYRFFLALHCIKKDQPTLINKVIDVRSENEKLLRLCVYDTFLDKLVYSNKQEELFNLRKDFVKDQFLNSEKKIFPKKVNEIKEDFKFSNLNIKSVNKIFYSKQELGILKAEADKLLIQGNRKQAIEKYKKLGWKSIKDALGKL